MGRLVRRRHVTGPSEDAVVPEALERFNFTRDIVEALADGPGGTALRFVDAQGVIDTRTFKDLSAAAGRWTALLQSRGLVPGDRVLVLLGKSPSWPAVLLGALKGGFVIVSGAATLSTDDVELRLWHSGARLLVVDHVRAAALAGMESDVDVVIAEDVATELRALDAIQPTHDTTVVDTAVILYSPDMTQATVYTHGDTRIEQQATGELDAADNDVVWRTSDPGSAASIWNALLIPWSLGAQTVIHDADFDVDERFALIRRLGVTVLCQSPSEFRVMAEHALSEAADLGGVRRAVSVGGALDPEVVDTFHVTFGLTVEEETEEASLGGTVEHAGSRGDPAVAATDPVEALNGQVTGLALPTTPTMPDGLEDTVAAPPGRPNTGIAAPPTDDILENERREAERRAAELKQRDEAAAEEARLAEAEARRAAEEQAKADERDREQQEKAAAEQALEDEREAEAQRRAAAAIAAAEARKRQRLDEAAANEARRADAEARRSADEQAKADERERKQQAKAAAEQARQDERERKQQAKAAAERARQDERERKQQAKAAAEQARQDEREAEAERRAAAARAEADARERKQQTEAAAKEARRAANEKAKAEEQERKQQARAAAEQARREEAERRRSQERAREEAQGQRGTEQPATVGRTAANGAEERDDEETPNTALLERLRAYSHHANGAGQDPPAE